MTSSDFQAQLQVIKTNAVARMLSEDRTPEQRDAADDAVARLKLFCQETYQDVANKTKDAIIAATDQIKNGGISQQTFYGALDNINNASRNNMNDAMDVMYDKAISLSHDYPSAQGRLLDVMSAAGRLGNDLLTRIINFTRLIRENLQAFLNSAVQQIQAFAASNTDLISHYFGS